MRNRHFRVLVSVFLKKHLWRWNTFIRTFLVCFVLPKHQSKTVSVNDKDFKMSMVKNLMRIHIHTHTNNEIEVDYFPLKSLAWPYIKFLGSLAHKPSATFICLSAFVLSFPFLFWNNHFTLEQNYFFFLPLPTPSCLLYLSLYRKYILFFSS